MILHLLTDDKFTDYVINEFSASEMKSELVLIPSNNAMNLVEQKDKCRVVRQFSAEYHQLKQELSNYTAILFHGLMCGSWQNDILASIPSSVHIAWMVWGGEVYSRQEMFLQFMQPISRLIYKIHSCKRHQKSSNNEIKFELFQKIDFCLTNMPEEYEYVKRFINKDIKYIWYNYYSIEETISSLVDKRCQGSNVWIGNSAAEKNNHIDIFLHMKRRLSHKQISSRDYIIPLSYGAPWWKNIVLKVGHLIFKNRMIPLLDFISRDEYNAKMLSCSTMIIGYLQPAAHGNLMTALWLGMRVYLHESSMDYHYFKRIGCIVFSIEKDMTCANNHVFDLLSDAEVAQNRSALLEWYSMQNMHRRNLELVNILSTPKQC